MLQDNPLLSQLKQQLNSQKKRIEGTVKTTDKGYGFLEDDSHKRHFIAPINMKKVLRGDRIIAVIEDNQGKEAAIPEKLITQAFTLFIGQIQFMQNRCWIIPEGYSTQEAICCNVPKTLSEPLKDGDWIQAKLIHHSLENNKPFLAEFQSYITNKQDRFAKWRTSLVRNHLEISAIHVDEDFHFSNINNLNYTDYTDQLFFTIDNESSEDLDDAISIKALEHIDGAYQIMVAIADPNAYFEEDSTLDKLIFNRAMTTYLPSYCVPMLPEPLSFNICSLRPHQRRAALILHAIILSDGAIDESSIKFNCGWIESKIQLNYNQVSAWLEGDAQWEPEPELASALKMLSRLCDTRIQWRKSHALLFSERLEYRYEINAQGKLASITPVCKQQANKMIEEMMIIANICAAHFLNQQSPYGLYSTHAGFDKTHIDSVISILNEYHINFDKEYLLTLEGFIELNRLFLKEEYSSLKFKLRRYITYADLSFTPSAHYGLGLPLYATWTSPIRKYNDLINHRIIKKTLSHQEIKKPTSKSINHINERRKSIRIVEKDILDYLYFDYLKRNFSPDSEYLSEIIEINRGGMRVKIISNGATIFIPLSFIHSRRNEIQSIPEKGLITIESENKSYQFGEQLLIKICQFKEDSQSILGKLAS